MSISVRNFDKSTVPKPKFKKIKVPNNMNLNIEIGCGVGWHPIQWSKKNPNDFLVAIEHTRVKFEKFKRRSINHNLTNLLPLHENAISVIGHLVKKNSVSNYFLLYPNPNPKSLNQRWHAMPFMGWLLQTLKPNGTLTLSTNKLFYKNEALIYYKNYWNLELVENIILNNDEHIEYQTHFEKKYIERGENCFKLVLKKT